MSKLIERDHINNHYRRLNGAQSSLQLARNCGKSTKSLTKSKSTPDISFETRQQQLERRLVRDFSLDTSFTTSKKLSTISDDRLDVMSRHSEYFTHPTKMFTPRVLQKIVPPSLPPEAAKKWRSSAPASRSSSRTNVIQRSGRSSRRVYSESPVNDDVIDHQKSTPKLNHSSDFPVEDFQKWIRQQYGEIYFNSFLVVTTIQFSIQFNITKIFNVFCSMSSLNHHQIFHSLHI